MTNEEAIKGLKVLAKDFSGYKPNEKMFEMAIKALQTQQKQTTCDFCHEDREGYIKPIEKNCHAFVSFGINGWGLYLQAKGWHNEVQINYCPMCGRELKKVGEG